MSRLTLTAIPDIAEITSGDRLGVILADATGASGYIPTNNDILIVSQKIVSKAEGRLVQLSDVTPSPEAVALAEESDKDPAIVELILRESEDVLRVRPGLIIVRHRLGIVLANAGIDQSNLGSEKDESALLLPTDPDNSACELLKFMQQRFKTTLAVLVIDSVGRPWRNGVVGLAIGTAGLPPLVDLRGDLDRDGRPLAVTEVALADQIAAAASLLMGEADEGQPAVWLRGLKFEVSQERASVLLRPKELDLFQ